MKFKHLIVTFLFITVFSHSVKGQQILNSFSSPGDTARGLAWDGEYLWCADAGTDSVYKLDPADGTILSSFTFSIGSSYGGITWSDDNNIWIANGSCTYKVDPTNGNSLSNFCCGCW